MSNRTAYVVIGLGWGDESKGSITDALCRKTGASLVIRFNGGPQAAHHVVLADGRSHCFSSFGAGTLAGADTYLSEHVLIDPFAILKEAEALERLGVTDPLRHLFIHRDCLVITPLHRALNRAREAARGDARHGSCGVGLGEAVRMAQEHSKRGALRMLDLVQVNASTSILRYQWMSIQDEYMQLSAEEHLQWPWPGPDSETFLEDLGKLSRAYQQFASHAHVVDDDWLRYRTDSVVVCEGAQGVLLDEDYGFPPHTTWSSCTPANAYAALAPWAEVDTKIVKIGVTRAYATRHGQGPFPTETEAAHYTDAYNGDHPWQGRFRVGHLDVVLLSYAIRACGGIDYFAVTHLDQLHWPIKAAYNYQDWRGRVGPLPLWPHDTVGREALGALLGSVQPVHMTFSDVESFLKMFTGGWPLGIVSRGPTAEDKLFLETGAEPWSSPTKTSVTA